MTTVFFATMPHYLHMFFPALDLRILRVLRLLRMEYAQTQ